MREAEWGERRAWEPLRKSTEGAREECSQAGGKAGLLPGKAQPYVATVGPSSSELWRRGRVLSRLSRVGEPVLTWAPLLVLQSSPTSLPIPV